MYETEFVTTPPVKARGFYSCACHAERDCSPSLNIFTMLGVLLNTSFANRIEKGQFIPELKQGDFLRPVLKEPTPNLQEMEHMP